MPGRLQTAYEFLPLNLNPQSPFVIHQDDKLYIQAHFDAITCPQYTFCYSVQLTQTCRRSCCQAKAEVVRNLHRIALIYKSTQTQCNLILNTVTLICNWIPIFYVRPTQLVTVGIHTPRHVRHQYRQFADTCVGLPGLVTERVLEVETFYSKDNKAEPQINTGILQRLIQIESP